MTTEEEVVDWGDRECVAHEDARVTDERCCHRARDAAISSVQSLVSHDTMSVRTTLIRRSRGISDVTNVHLGVLLRVGNRSKWDTEVGCRSQKI